MASISSRGGSPSGSLLALKRPQGRSVVGSAVGNRNMSLQGTNVSTVGTYRFGFTCRFDCTDLRFRFLHYNPGGGGGAEAIAAGAIVFRASLDDGTNLYPLTKNGSRDLTLTTGLLDTDPLAVELVAGTTYFVRTFLVSGTAWATHVNVLSGEGFTATTDLTAPGSAAVGGGFQFQYGPSLITGIPTQGTTRLPAVGITGDSIARGQGDNLWAGHGSGFIVDALEAAALPNCNMAIGGATGITLSNPSFRVLRGSILADCDYIVDENGVNDLSGGYTFTQITTAFVSLWRAWWKRGAIVYRTTVMPHSTSTDSFATLGNQTPVASESVRVALNDWIRAGAPLNATTFAPVAVGTSGAILAGSATHPLAGYFEVADTVESGRNSGKWAVGMTTDGLHPVNAGHVAATAAINTALFTAR